ncbi:MAG: Gfo/Idh/MocA family oxidoreductase [Pseudomonadota bacterium]
MADTANGPHGVTRRSLIGATAVTAGLTILPGRGHAETRRPAPSDRVNIAVIGAGGMGASNMSKLTSQNIVALADADFDHVEESLRDKQGRLLPDRVALKEAYDKAPKFADYRRMLDKQKDVDAVLIATPDHHHAVAAKMAMERGLHVYVQKPLTYTVREARTLLGIARANPKLVTQMGNQGHSGHDGRRVVELIRADVIGRIGEVHVWTNRPVWPQGVAKPPAQPVPESLDWDVWRGPATADWGYHPDYAHFNWRGWVPFGCGALGDMGAHLIDFPVWALEPGLPTRIETRHSAWGGDTNPWDGRGPAELTSYPLASVTHYEFGHAPRGPLRMTWYDGGLMPPTPEGWPAGLRMDPGGGVLYVGERGMLIHGTYGDRPNLVGVDLQERVNAVPMSLPRVPGGKDGHEMNWVRAIRGVAHASCPFEYAVPLTETMLLGLVALRAEQPITYDGAAGRITNNADANRFLDREYRAGWEF